MDDFYDAGDAGAAFRMLSQGFENQARRYNFVRVVCPKFGHDAIDVMIGNNSTGTDDHCTQLKRTKLLIFAILAKLKTILIIRLI